MIVGVGIIDLHIDGCQSLKEKRQILKSLKTRIHNNFNISITELDDVDLWQRSKLGVTCAANDRASVDAMLNKVTDYIRREKAVSIIDISTEIR